LYFAADGTLDHFIFGPSCTFALDGQASCILNLAPASDDWIVTDTAFLYSHKFTQCLGLDCSTSDGSGSGRTSFQLQTTSVPEPNALALCGLALMALGSTYKRRGR
jgi:hypothetical protein